MSEINPSLSNSEYHSHPSLSSSQIKIAYDNIALFKKAVIDKSLPNKSKQAYKIGTLFHELVLEPEVYNPIVYPYPEMDKRKREYKEWVAENPDIDLDNVVNAKEVAQLEAMKASIDAYEDGTISRILNNTENEKSIFYTIGEQDYRIRPDAYAVHEDHVHIYDLKTTSKSVSRSEFIRQVISLKYDLSAAMYIQGLSRCLELPCRFSWVVVQAVEPFSTVVYHMDAETFRYGKEKLEVAVENIKNAETKECYQLQKSPESLLSSEDDNLLFRL